MKQDLNWYQLLQQPIRAVCGSTFTSIFHSGSKITIFVSCLSTRFQSRTFTLRQCPAATPFGINKPQRLITHCMNSQSCRQSPPPFQNQNFNHKQPTQKHPHRPANLEQSNCQWKKKRRPSSPTKWVRPTLVPEVQAVWLLLVLIGAVGDNSLPTALSTGLVLTRAEEHPIDILAGHTVKKLAQGFVALAAVAAVGVVGLVADRDVA